VVTKNSRKLGYEMPDGAFVELHPTGKITEGNSGAQEIFEAIIFDARDKISDRTIYNLPISSGDLGSEVIKEYTAQRDCYSGIY